MWNLIVNCMIAHHTITLPLHHADERRRLEEIPLENYNAINFQYLADVNIHNQSVTVIIDTGSSDLWVMEKDSTFTPQNTKCGQGALSHLTCFDDVHVDTNNAQTSKIAYGDGSVQVHVKIGLIEIEMPTEDGTCTIQNQKCGIATELFNFTTTQKMAGILGMGFESLAQWTKPTVFHNIIETCDVRPIQGWHLSTHQVDGSTLTIGGPPPGTNIDDFIRIPLYRTGYWEIELQQMTVGTETVALPVTLAILDSGMSHLAINTDDGLFNDVITAIKEQATNFKQESSENGATYLDADNFPTLSFYMNGYKFDVEPQYYTNENGTRAMIQGFSMARHSVILGTSFMMPHDVIKVAGDNPYIGVYNGTTVTMAAQSDNNIDRLYLYIGAGVFGFMIVAWTIWNLRPMAPQTVSWKPSPSASS